jgi:hypothetical protein
VTHGSASGLSVTNGAPEWRRASSTSGSTGRGNNDAERDGRAVSGHLTASRAAFGGRTVGHVAAPGTARTTVAAQRGQRRIAGGGAAVIRSPRRVPRARGRYQVAANLGSIDARCDVDVLTPGRVVGEAGGEVERLRGHRVELVAGDTEVIAGALKAVEHVGRRAREELGEASGGARFDQAEMMPDEQLAHAF